MNGNALLDSNAIIYFSKGAIDFNKLIEKYDNFIVSIISYIEVMGFNFKDKNEEELVKELFKNLEIIDVNFEIANLCLNIRKDNKIKLPDAIILATAIKYNCDLITANERDFAFCKEIKIINPFKN
ncbi:MAG: type II toxin-antitoxin system VapC family toxin [Brevinematia bacterium]